MMDIVVNPFIDGTIWPSVGEGLVDLCNPATGQLSFAIPAGCSEDVQRALASSRIAFEDGRWRDKPPSQRQAILNKFADLIEGAAVDLDVIDAMDMGKPVSLGFGNSASAASLLRYYAEAVCNLTGHVYNSDKTTFITQQQRPRGVVAAITPWNFPTYNAITKLAPALAAGNSVVLKPSENSSRSAMRLMILAMEAGIPPGVLNMVPGSGAIIGQALALHRDVDMLAFTGSTLVGKQLLRYAGQSNMKLVQAECGGKSPQIVFADVEDLDLVAEHVAAMILCNQGQLCVAGSRLLVQKEIEAILVEKLVNRFQQIVVGDPTDAKTTYGPLVNEQQREKVEGYIEAGKQEGELVCGGNRLLSETGGYYLQPTLFSGVTPDATIAQEEIFGPVLAVTHFDDVDEAVQLANASEYGLAAYAWTNNLSVSMKLSKGIRTGMLMINAAAPVGEGSKTVSMEPCGLSGIGVEHGLVGLESYLRRQVTWVNYGE